MFDTDHNLFWILVFAVPITSIIMGSLSRMARYRALSKLAEQGKPIPPELMSAREDHGGGMVSRGALRGGIVMICIGIGLAIFFFAMTGAGGFTHGVTSNHDVDWLPAIGAIPFMIGVGLVVSAAVDRRRPDDPK
jgi:hypothetical protein